MSRQRIITCGVLVCVMSAVLAGCETTRNALPEKLADQAQPVGVPDVRAWGDCFSPLFQQDLVESIRQARRGNPDGYRDKAGFVNALAISGGGSDGAFGAGLLAGWTQSGQRPEFKLVTGVSTGALIAPFAFLGPAYDAQLKTFYTTTSTKDVVQNKPLLGALFGSDSLADSTPLGRMIEKCITPDVLKEIAREHNRGRRLLICTTNLDARRPVIWNMGAIAASGRPGALDLFRKVMRASASIPVAMNPMFINVEAGGARYDEMHVDGGVTTEVFLYGFMWNLPAAIEEALGQKRPDVRIHVYVVRNGQFRSEYEQVQPRLGPIASRAVSSLIDGQSIGDLYRIYTISRIDGIDFLAISIPTDFVSHATQMFDPADMTRLYNVGFELGAKGGKWATMPPGLEKLIPPTSRPSP